MLAPSICSICDVISVVIFEREEAILKDAWELLPVLCSRVAPCMLRLGIEPRPPAWKTKPRRVILKSQKEPLFHLIIHSKSISVFPITHTGRHTCLVFSDSEGNIFSKQVSCRLCNHPDSYCHSCNLQSLWCGKSKRFIVYSFPIAHPILGVF